MCRHDSCLFGSRENVRARIGMEALNEVRADFSGLYGRMKCVDHPYPDTHLDVWSDVRRLRTWGEEALEPIKDRLHLRLSEFNSDVVHRTPNSQRAMASIGNAMKI